LYKKNVTVTVVVKRTERDSNITEFCLYQSIIVHCTCHVRVYSNTWFIKLK